MRLGIDHPDFSSRVLDLSPGIVFVTDAQLRITFVNDAATDLLGYDRHEVLGMSVLDFLDTDWNPEAFASIATALGSAGGQRQPMTFRAISKDGRRPIIEATANVQLDDPVIGGVVVYARPWTERWLLDRTLESVAAGDPIDRTMSLLVDVAGADTMEADALRWRRATGRCGRGLLTVTSGVSPRSGRSPGGGNRTWTPTRPGRG